MPYVRTRVFAAVCALALAAAAPVRPADPPDAEVDRSMARIRPEAIRAHMRFLADDLLEGRGTGSRGYELAAKYVAARFEALGLAPAGTEGGYFQPVPLRRTATVASKCSLALLRDGKRTELKFGEDYVLSGSNLTATDAQVTAPLVFAGFGVSAPELGYDDYAGLDVQGKIVVVLSGTPATFPNDQHAFYSSTQLKADEAFAHGAFAVLGIQSPADAQRLPWKTMVRYVGAPSYQWLNEAGVPDRSRPQARGFGLLSRETAVSLFAATPHPLDEIFKAAEAGRPQSFALPVQASLRTVSEHERAESPNVAALLRGSDPRLRDEVIVLTAHLDHLGISEPVEGDSIYNGAYDNASGVASLLEIANAFASLPEPPRRSVLFLAVTGEEQGLQGSDYFVRHPTVPRDKIVGNINVDMFLMLHPLRDVIAFGAEHSSLGPLAERAARRLGLAMTQDPFPQEVVFIRSDQFSFIRAGIPALMLDTGLQADDPAAATAAAVRWLQTTYHQPGDDMKQAFDFEAGAQFVRLNFLVSYLAAQEDQAPHWNPGDFFGERKKKR
ncbi:MAG TPA: M28 family metallopeptidase [Thermoanaerobaculia bacterium]|nr:M28 family metallopeptidase [Thermoanaerobaculia bacterium]